MCQNINLHETMINVDIFRYKECNTLCYSTQSWWAYFMHACIRANFTFVMS